MLGWIGKWSGSKGMGRIPDIEGLSLNDARNAIINAGFSLGTETVRGNSQGATLSNNGKAKGRDDVNELLNYESVLDFEYYVYTTTPAPTPAPVVPPYFVPPFFPPFFTPAPTTPAPTTPAPTTPAPTTPAPTTPAPTTPAPVATVYWYTGCCNGTQVTGTSTIDFNAAFSSMNSQCGSTVTDQQSGVYSGTSNIPTLACSSTPAPTPAPTTPAPTTPAPTTPAPAPNAYWYTGCCSTTGEQVTGTSSSDFTAAYNSMLNKCSGSVTNQQSGVGGTIPSVSCSSTPAPTTPAPVALTYCPSLGYNVPSSGYPGNCPGASTPAPTTPPYFVPPFFPPYFVPPFFPPSFTPAPTTPAPATPAPTTPAPATPAPTTPAPATPAPVALTYCPSLGYNVPSSGYPGNCPGYRLDFNLIK